MRLAVALLFVFVLFVPASLRAQVKIIYDTDMDTDCDDAGALAILHALADRGEAEILATVVSSRYPWSAPCVEAINRYYHREDLPIGVPKTKWADTGGRLQETPTDNPVRRIYELYVGKGETRPSWDPIGVLFGVRSQADIWKIQTDGHNHIFANGTNQWRDGPKTNHRLVLLQPGTAKRLRETLDQLMVQAPRPKR